MGEMEIIYEAFFIEDPSGLKQEFPAVHPNTFYHHLTIAFKPKGLTSPCEVGQSKLLRIIGRLTTNKIDALVVVTPELDKDFPHITLSTAEGVKPNECNGELKNHSHRIQYFDKSKYVRAVYGYFNGKEIVLTPLQSRIENKVPEYFSI